MNIKKYGVKCVAALMSAVFTVTALPSLLVAAADNNDIANQTSAEKAIELMIDLGIIKGTGEGFFSFFSDEEITRAEFAGLLCNMINLQNTSASNQPFTDVPLTHPYAGQIAALSQMNIFSGYDDGSFRPDEPLTGAMAVRGIVSVLGYSKTAEMNGGSYKGYYSAAASLNLLKGCSISENEPILRGQLALMMENAIDVDIMTMVINGSSISYEPSKGDNYLSYYWGYREIDGRITGTDTTYLDRADALPVGYIRLDNEIFRFEDKHTEPNDVLGKRVKAYYYESDDDQMCLTAIRVNKNYDNDTLIISGDDIEEFDETTRKISYYKSNRNTLSHITISADADVIYNGRYTNAYTSDMLSNVHGHIELIKSKGNNDYNLVKITNYETLIVSNVSTLQKQVYNYYKPSEVLTLDVEDGSKRISISDSGIPMKLEDIREWDVLDVAKSVDGNVISVYVSRDSFRGEVKNLRNDDDGKYVFVNNREYKIVDGTYDQPNAPYELTTTSHATFYLNKFGEIAGWSSEASESHNDYALLIKAYRDTDNGDDSLKVRMLTASSEVVDLSCAEKFKIDNDTFRSGTLNNAIDVLHTPESAGVDYRKIIKYRTDSSGRITMIDTAARPNPSKEEFSLADTLTDAQYFTTPLASFGGNTLMGPDTITFVMPAFEEIGELMDYYTTKATSYFAANTKYNVSIYAEKYSYVYPEAISVVRNNKGSSTSRTDDVIIVKKITTGVDDDGEERPQLEGIQNGNDVTFILEDESVWTNAYSPYGGTSPNPEDPYIVKPGDVIRISNNIRGQVAMIQVIYRVNQNDLVGVTDGNAGKHWSDTLNVNYASQNRFVLGYVYDRMGSLISVAPTEDKAPLTYDDTPKRPKNAEFYNYTDANIYRVTIKNKKTFIEKEESPEFIPVMSKTDNATRVFVYSYNGVPKTILIIDYQR